MTNERASDDRTRTHSVGSALSHTGTAMAQAAKVTSLMSKDLTDIPGKEVFDDHRGVCARRWTSQIPSSPSTEPMHMDLFTCWRAPL